MTVRVRFAPSPTGHFHIGSARTALFNWLYARHTGGTFILRIEDTDRERNTPEALQVLLDGMRWLGLNWDEGPEAGGGHGPYFQSERDAIYREHLDRLKEAGRTYEKDGAIYFRLEGERYTEFDPRLGQEVEKVKAAPQVIVDQVRGRVERAEQKDFVIVRSNGQPVFHLVNVVDDITMGITHVIRGEDHLSNTSKHCELFQALGAPLPVFAHIPLILKSSGPGKMGKRDEGALIEDYGGRHFLAEAVRNYLCLLGWSPKDDREVIPIDELIALFDFPGINKGNARFDERKLSAINAHYLRALPLETFAWMARPVLEAAGLDIASGGEDYLQAVLGLCQEKVVSLEGLPDYAGYFFDEDFATDPAAREKVFKKGDPPARLAELSRAFGDMAEFGDEAALEAALKGCAEAAGAKPAEYIHATRLAVSGTNAGPAFYGLLRVLGKERVLGRIGRFLQTAGAPGPA